MKEKTTKYIKSVLRHIKAGDKTKERIKFDLETEFENKMESGLTIDEIIAEKGSAKSVADEFNMSYRDSSVKKITALKSFWQYAGQYLFYCHFHLSCGLRSTSCQTKVQP